MRKLIAVNDEQWRPVPGYPGYSVSTLGRVKHGRVTGDFELQGKVDRTGYRQVGLFRGGSQTWFMLHRLVACAFIDNASLTSDPDHFLTVNHKDRDKLNNRLDNLELVSVADNHRHWRKHPLLTMKQAT